MKKSKLIFFVAFIILFLSSFAAHAGDASLNVKSTLIAPPLDSAYFTIKPDFRKCISPICGGWFVNAVNRRVTQCPNGTVKKVCYVSTDKINIAGLSDVQIARLRQAMEESRVLIQGRLSTKVDHGLLEIDNAWLSASDQPPSGRFVSVSDNGIRCIVGPCPSYDGQILNRYFVKSLAGYDLSAVEASDGQLALAQEAVNSEDGLPMAGSFIEVTGPAGSAQGIAASQFYLKVESMGPKMCLPTGCSGQICADTDVVSTCEWRPEYACYSSASCSTQSNGDCGWVMDDELKRCLANAAVDNLLQSGGKR